MTDQSVLKQISGLKNLTYPELRALYASLHGREAPSYNRDFLTKRIAYRIQELAYGGVPQRTLDKLDQVLVAHGYDENAMPKRRGPGRPKAQACQPGHPVPGTLLIREWRGKRYEVKSLPDGFEYDGRKYRSLTAVAKEITGAHWNGKVFFGLPSGRREGSN